MHNPNHKPKQILWRMVRIFLCKFINIKVQYENTSVRHEVFSCSKQCVFSIIKSISNFPL